jgi:hypothetical protein
MNVSFNAKLLTQYHNNTTNQDFFSLNVYLCIRNTLQRQAKKFNIETGKIKYNWNGGIIDGYISVWMGGLM